MKYQYTCLSFALALLFTFKIHAQSLDFGEDFFDQKNTPNNNQPSNNQPSNNQPSNNQPSNNQNQNTTIDAQSAQSTESAQPTESAQSTKEILSEKQISADQEPIAQITASRLGAIGLLDTFSANTGVQGTFRFRLTTGGFSSSDFLNARLKQVPATQREETFSLTHIALAYSPLPYLETWLSIKGSSYRNPVVQPNLMQSLGDTHLGVKVSRFWGIFGLGAVSQLNFISDPKSNGFKLGATGADFRLLLTFDLLRTRQIPFRFLFDLQYTIENGSTLYRKLPEEPSVYYEWGNQAWRYNRMMINTGIEFPTKWVSPFAEYHIGTPFQVEMLRIGKGAQPFKFESVPHWMTLGLRAFPLESLAVDLSYQIGFSDSPATGVLPTPPWSLWFGLSYTLDPRPVVIEKTVAQKAVQAIGTLFKAQVVDEQSKQPIAKAVIQYEIVGLSAQTTTQDGQISGYRLPVGNVKMVITAPQYQRKEINVKIPEQAEFKAKISLKPMSASDLSPIQIFVVDSSEQKQSATITQISMIATEANQELAISNLQKNWAQLTNKSTSETQALKIALFPGEYVATIQTNDQAEQVVTFKVTSQTKEIALKLSVSTASSDNTSDEDFAKNQKSKGSSKSKNTEKPTATKGISLKGKQVVLQSTIVFDGDSADLNPKSLNALEAIKTFLASNPSTKLTMEVHTHLVQDADTSMALSQDRGKRLINELKALGVASQKIKLKPMGASKNTVPNVSQKGRTQNQKVLFYWQ